MDVVGTARDAEVGSALGEDRVRRWESRTAWPLFAGAVALLGILTWTSILERPSAIETILSAVSIVVLWVWFAVDWAVRLVLSGPHRRWFLRTRAIDLASLVLPLLRPFLILVYVWRLPVFRTADRPRQRMRYVVVTILFAFIYVYTCSYAVWIVERRAPGATIVNFGDALWWGFCTISTVGYGDYAPVTIPGRFIAVGLMVGGVFVVGVVTATLISDLNDRVRAAVRAAHEDDDAGARK